MIQTFEMWLALPDTASDAPAAAVEAYHSAEDPLSHLLDMFQHEFTTASTPQQTATFAVGTPQQTSAYAGGTHQPAAAYTVGTPQPTASYPVGHLTQSPVGHQMMQQQVPVYPMVYQNQMVRSTPYLLEQTPTRHTSAASFSPMTPMSSRTSMSLSPGYTPPTTPMSYSNSYGSPRGMTAYNGRRQNAARVARSPFSYSSGHHNHVDVERIRSGIDVRTTVSLFSCVHGDFSADKTLTD